MSISGDGQKFTLSYDFTAAETVLLAKFLRENQPEIPSGLEHFARTVEDAVYSSLSVDEARDFYS